MANPRNLPPQSFSSFFVKKNTPKKDESSLSTSALYQALGLELKAPESLSVPKSYLFYGKNKNGNPVFTGFTQLSAAQAAALDLFEQEALERRCLWNIPVKLDQSAPVVSHPDDLGFPGMSLIPDSVRQNSTKARTHFFSKTAVNLEQEQMLQKAFNSIFMKPDLKPSDLEFQKAQRLGEKNAKHPLAFAIRRVLEEAEKKSALAQRKKLR